MLRLATRITSISYGSLNGCCINNRRYSLKNFKDLNGNSTTFMINHGPFKIRLLSSAVHPQQRAKLSAENSDDELSIPESNFKATELSVVDCNVERLKQISKEFSSLNKKQLKNDEIIWKDIPKLTASSLLDNYSRLAKIRLTGLVVLTTLAGYYMAIDTGLNASLLAATLVGTSLTSASAASWNHFLEVPFDSQMRRTQARPLVQGSLTPLHAASFALVTGVSGLTILATCVNPLTAMLGAANLCLYSFVYTPLKRVHIVNTWIGAIVGAIPPIMGFTAANNYLDLPSLLLGLVLYSWQFPHFNALSWNMRHEYARAGYRMMSVTNPRLCQQTALRHSALLMVYTSAMCIADMTHWSFAIDSLPFTIYLLYLSYRFRKNPSSQTSRKLFLYSLIYLPVIMLLMIISKNRHSKQSKKSATIKTKQIDNV